MTFSSTNLSENPDFAAWSSNDFSLLSGSPCIDAGNPSSEFNDPDGTRNDMGAFGGSYGDWDPAAVP